MTPRRVCLLIAVLFAFAQAAVAKDQLFKFGVPLNIISGLNGADAKITTEAIFNQAVFRDMNFEALLYEDQEEYLNSIRNSELAGAVMRSIDYIAMCEEGIPLKGNNLTITGGTSPLVQYVLLAKKQSDKQTLKDFKGKRLIFGHGSGNKVDQVWLDVLLAKEGVATHEQFFGSKDFVVETSKALVPLFFGKNDVSLVRRHRWELMSELNPQLGTHLEVIAESPMLLETLTCLNPGVVSKQTQDNFANSLAKMHLTPKGKSLLTITKVKKFVRFEEKYLDSVRVLMDEYHELIGSQQLSQSGGQP